MRARPALTLVFATVTAVALLAQTSPWGYASPSPGKASTTKEAGNILQGGATPIPPADLQAAAIGTLSNGQSADPCPTPCFTDVTIKNCSSYDFKGYRKVTLVRIQSNPYGNVGTSDPHRQLLHTWTVTSLPANQSLHLQLPRAASGAGEYFLTLSRGDDNLNNDNCVVRFGPPLGH